MLEIIQRGTVYEMASVVVSEKILREWNNHYSRPNQHQSGEARYI